MWTIRLLENTDFFLGELDVERCNRVGEMVWLGGPNNRRGHHRVLQHPGQCDVRHRDAPSFGDLLDRFHDGFVALDVEPAADGIDLGALAVFTPWPGKSSLGK